MKVLHFVVWSIVMIILAMTTAVSILLMSNSDWNITEQIFGLVLLVGSPIVVGGVAVLVIYGYQRQKRWEQGRPPLGYQAPNWSSMGSYYYPPTVEQQQWPHQ